MYKSSNIKDYNSGTLSFTGEGFVFDSFYEHSVTSTAFVSLKQYLVHARVVRVPVDRTNHNNNNNN